MIITNNNAQKYLGSLIRFRNPEVTFPLPPFSSAFLREFILLFVLFLLIAAHCHPLQNNVIYVGTHCTDLVIFVTENPGM